LITGKMSDRPSVYVRVGNMLSITG
jgi:hypothetical protein